MILRTCGATRAASRSRPEEMDPGEDVEIDCPYCGAVFAVAVDPSENRCDMIEDCAVCCRPIRLRIRCEDGEIVALDADRA